MHHISAPMELSSRQNNQTWAACIFKQVLFAHRLSEQMQMFGSSLCVSFSRAQRHACCPGLMWAERGHGPAISIRLGRPAGGGSDLPGEEEPFAFVALLEMSTNLPLLQLFSHSHAHQGSLGCRRAQMELQP